MRRTPADSACARNAAHSRSNRTWSATEPRRAQSSIQYALRSRKSSSSDRDTGARGEASSPGHAANADADLYGDPCRSGGPSGSICHHDCPASASQSTNWKASRPSRPPGSEVGCSWTPLDRGRCMRSG